MKIVTTTVLETAISFYDETLRANIASINLRICYTYERSNLKLFMECALRMCVHSAKHAHTAHKNPKIYVRTVNNSDEKKEKHFTAFLYIFMAFKTASVERLERLERLENFLF